MRLENGLMFEGGRAARDVYVHLGGRRSVSVSELLAAFDCERLDEQTARRITGALGYSGLRCRPSLFDVLARRGVRIEARADTARYNSPRIAACRTELQNEEVCVSASPVFALQGALLAALVVGSIGYYRWWPYGLVALIASMVAIGGLLYTFPFTSRRLPLSLPRGRIMGATVTAIVTILAILLFAAVR
jgi:hypothetical protein